MGKQKRLFRVTVLSEGRYRNEFDVIAYDDVDARCRASVAAREDDPNSPVTYCQVEHICDIDIDATVRRKPPKAVAK